MTTSRILIVDDERGVVRSCVRILQRQGYTVVGRTDSESAPELLRQETFDLLLTDIRMPKIDGLELLRIAKEIDPHLTVVLITGYGTMEDAIKAIRLGAQGFIMKPFEPEDLIDTVKDNLVRRDLIRDSLRLQTLLPLLEINQILRPEDRTPGGEKALARRVLEIAYRETSAARIAWLSYQDSLNTSLSGKNLEAPENIDPGEDNLVGKTLIEMAVAPAEEPPPSTLPLKALITALTQSKPVGVLADDSLIENIEAQPNIVGVALPLVIKGKAVGVLAAETERARHTGPFNQISLELLSVVGGQLAIVLENVQLFQQTETLHAFNEDIIQNMTNGLIVTDERNRITAFNPAASSMLGYQSSEVLHQPLEEVATGADELIRLFNTTLETRQPCSHLEVTLRRRDGTDLPVAVSMAPMVTRHSTHESMGVVAVLEDLSEQKALEAERRRLDRLAALGEMSAVVAHEIRNPIAGIAAGVDYFTRNIPTDSPDYAGAAMIQGEIERVNRILEDILFIARPLQLNLAREDILTIIENVVQRCQPQIKESQVDVTLRCNPDIPPLRVDRQRLEQVLTNLIINAAQAMSNGGEILLEVDTVKTREGTQRGSVVVTVADTGPGIPVETQHRIFEPFFTTKTKGTGLGLAVARRIVEQHRGIIKGESEEGKGARFIIELPIEQGTTS